MPEYVLMDLSQIVGDNLQRRLALGYSHDMTPNDLLQERVTVVGDVRSEVQQKLEPDVRFTSNLDVGSKNYRVVLRWIVLGICYGCWSLQEQSIRLAFSPFLDGGSQRLVGVGDKCSPGMCGACFVVSAVKT